MAAIDQEDQPSTGASVQLRQQVGRSGSRVVYLDAVRGVALARVVLFHALGQSWVLAFSALPLMFFVAGWLFAASLDNRGSASVTWSRFRRILPSYWVYVAAMVTLWAVLGVLWELSAFDWLAFAMPVLFPGVPPGPGAGTDLSLTWEALWYIQMHLVLALVGPWLRRVQQRRAVLLWTCLAVVTLLTWLLVPAGTLPFVFLGSWVLGYHHHDGQLQMLLPSHRRNRRGDVGVSHDRRTGSTASVLLRRLVARCWWPTVVVLGVMFMVSVAAVALSADGSTASANSGPTKVGLQAATLGMAALGAFWLVVAVRYQPAIEPRLYGHRTRSTIAWVSQRSLTIYLWHMAAIYAAVSIPLPGSSNWAIRIGWCLVGTLIAVLAFGWLEDLAARRKTRLWPTQVIDLTRIGATSADGPQST